VAGLHFGKTMRWNSSNVSFSRPLRWIVALYGDQIVPFACAGILSSNSSRGLRPQGSPDLRIPAADRYFQTMAGAGIVVEREERRRQVAEGIQRVSSCTNLTDSASLIQP